LDWLSVATFLIERGDQPMMLLDRSGRIQLLNAAMERTLGWRRGEIEGRLWYEACAPARSKRPTSRSLGQALSGALRRFELEAVTSDKCRVRLDVDVSSLGRNPARGLLLIVRRVTPVDGDRAYIENVANRDIDYQITAHASEFGTIRELVQMGQVVRLTGASKRRCFEILYSRQSPCEDCPALRAPRESWPRVALRRRTRATDGFEIVVAEPVGATTVGLSVRFINDGTLRAVHEARLARIADDAQLSRRERAVLDYLLMGRSLEDVATILKVSRHTVKFHQSNILRKLGADSRVDLFRLTGY
jgi:PAS domain S-box-containing protein